MSQNREIRDSGPEYQVISPVCMNIFNRPDTTRTVFETVRRVRPAKLFVIADGPRKDHPDDEQRCRETRAVIETVDWPCTVYRKYADANLGCCKNSWRGYQWVFEQTDRAIILEDDTVADISFFRYCDELLEKYADDPRVMSINGTNYAGRWDCSSNYFFSRYTNSWGWASWRRVWDHFDINMEKWKDPQVRERVRSRMTGSQYLVKNAMYTHYMNKEDTSTVWALMYEFCVITNDGLVAVPRENLVTNIGFGASATHTKENKSKDMIASHAMQFPMRHPAEFRADEGFDRELYRRLYNGPLSTQVKRRIKAVLNMPF